MPDVMISYSRADLDFVRDLAGSLERHGLDVWVDLEGIYVGEEFWAQLCAAIEGAENILFIISPHSVASDWCRKELEYALHCNKRIIPFVYERVADMALPSELNDREWYRYTDSDSQDCFASLADAIRLDPDWRRKHTRLLVRAKEWETSVSLDRVNGDDSYLLRGSDLHDALGWLQQSANKQPAPLTLHTRYIVLSQQVSARKQRRTIIGLTLALVTIVGISILALYQRHEAVEQRNIALSNQVKSQINYGAALIGQKRELAKAIAALEKAKLICKTFKSIGIECANVHYNLGNGYRDLGDFEIALKAYETAGAIVREHASLPEKSNRIGNRFIAHLLANVAYCHTQIAAKSNLRTEELAHYEIAEEYIDRAEGVLRLIADDVLTVRMKITRARVAIGLSEWITAERLLSEADKRISTDPNIPLLRAIIYDCTRQGVKALKQLSEFRSHYGVSEAERNENREQREYEAKMQYYEKLTDKCAVTEGSDDGYAVVPKQ